MSSFLKNKSDKNIQTANFILLNGTGFHASSVHCSYYSCVQLMLHILRSDFGKTDSQVDRESKAAAGGLHVWLIHLIIERYESKTDVYQARELRTKLIDLKKIRGISDYENEEITLEKAQSAYTRATLINSKLQSIFTI